MLVTFISGCWKDLLCFQHFTILYQDIEYQGVSPYRTKRFNNYFYPLQWPDENILLKNAYFWNITNVTISKNLLFILVGFEQFFCSSLMYLLFNTCYVMFSITHITYQWDIPWHSENLWNLSRYVFPSIHSILEILFTWFPKGQLISKCLFGVFKFFPKNERKQVDLRYHSSWVEFFRSVFGRIEDTKKFFWNQLTFRREKHPKEE